MLIALFYNLFSFKRLVFLSGFLPLGIIVLAIIMLGDTFANINIARKITNSYYGLSPDWENYCKASEWAAKNLPDTAVIACRKPSISFIYGKGRRFFGITETMSYPGSSLIQCWQEKGKDFYLIRQHAMEQSFPVDLFYTLTRAIVAYGTTIPGVTEKEQFRFYVMNFPPDVKEKIWKDLNGLHINPLHNLDTLRAYLSPPGERIKAIYPDTLLNILLRGHVTHVMEAHLRMNPSVKNGYLINTVERFMAYITVKYPQLLTQVVQIGSNDNEPAEIFQMNYNLCGMKFPK